MSEQQKIFENLIKFIDSHAQKRIALYGLGVNTEYILDNLNDTKIVGLADAKRAGEIYRGYKVFAADELQTMCDIVVVVSAAKNLKVIYKRISHISGIGIYSVDGTDLRIFFAEDVRYASNPYWSIDIESLIKEIDAHDVISFDLFDTLLMRRIIRPHDELGFEEEKRMNIPRRDVVKAFRYAVSTGKQVFILSDMYYSSAQLAELLELNGITGFSQIIVSCEHGATKEDGTLYCVLKSKAESSNILHIGDNENADIAKAHENGVDAFYIMSAYDMLCSSSFYDLLVDIQCKEDSLCLGGFAADVLNSPFALCRERGKLAIDDMDTIAGLFFPIILGFFQWLSHLPLEQDSIILFLARDGELIKRVYDIIRQCVVGLPDSIYFPASRALANPQYAENRKNYYEYAKKHGVFNYKKIYVYDLAVKGTLAAELTNIFERDIELLCFCSFNIAEKFDPVKAHSLLGDTGFYSPKYVFNQLYEILEILSVPNAPQFLYIDETLTPVYADNPPLNYAKIAEFQSGIIRRFEALLRQTPERLNTLPALDCADKIFGLVQLKYSAVSEDIKRIFRQEALTQGGGVQNLLGEV